jgi:hypothetical protein
MKIEAAQRIRDDYKKHLESGNEKSWLNLWVDDKPRLVSVYDRKRVKSILTEEYIGKEAIHKLIFGSREKLAKVSFSEELLDTTCEDTFFWTFLLKIDTKDGYQYENYMICRIAVEGDKVRELVEFGDPRARNDFFLHLKEDDHDLPAHP